MGDVRSTGLVIVACVGLVLGACSAPSSKPKPAAQLCTASTQCGAGALCSGGSCASRGCQTSCTWCVEPAEVTANGATLIASMPSGFRFVVNGNSLLLDDGNSLYTVPATGGTPTLLASQIGGSVGVADAANAYVGTSTGVTAVPLDGSAPTAIFQNQGAIYSALGIADDKLFVVADGNGWSYWWVSLDGTMQGQFWGDPGATSGMDANNVYIADAPQLLAIPVARAAATTSGLPMGDATVLGGFSGATTEGFDFSPPQGVFYWSYADVPSLGQCYAASIGVISKTSDPNGTGVLINLPDAYDPCSCNGVQAMAGAANGVYYGTDNGLFFLADGTCAPRLLSCAQVAQIVVTSPTVYFSTQSSNSTNFYSIAADPSPPASIGDGSCVGGDAAPDSGACSGSSSGGNGSSGGGNNPGG